MMIVMDWIYEYKKSTSEISNIMLYLLSTCFCHLKMIYRAPHKEDKVSPKSIKVWGYFKALSKSVC